MRDLDTGSPLNFSILNTDSECHYCINYALLYYTQGHGLSATVSCRRGGNDRERQEARGAYRIKTGHPMHQVRRVVTDQDGGALPT